jgi:putative ABC transport system permease protein
MTFVVRTGGDPKALIELARRAVAGIDPDHPLANAVLMDSFVTGRLPERGAYVLLLGVCALTVTALAMVGLYGLVAYAVVERRQEMAIRKALGAKPADLILLVGGRAVWLVGSGVLCGVVGASVVARVIAPQLWNVTPTDPATYVGAAIVVVGAALLVCTVSTQRAAAVESAVTLRLE